MNGSTPRMSREQSQRGGGQVTAYDAYLTAQFLASEGRADSDAVTHADMDTAADLAGARRPDSSDDRHTVRIALDTIEAAARRLSALVLT